MNQIGKTPEEIFEHDEDFHIEKIQELHKEKKRIESKIQKHRAELEGYTKTEDPKPVKIAKRLLRLPVNISKKVLNLPVSLAKKVISRVR